MPTLQASPTFRQSETVGLYLRSQWGFRLEGAPAGAAVDSAVVQSDGSLTFTANLLQDREYVAYAGTPDRYRSVDTPPAAATAPGLLPAWTPNTRYVKDQAVLSPDGTTVLVAKTGHTSGAGATPTLTNWNIVAELPGLHMPFSTSLRDIVGSTSSALVIGIKYFSRLIVGRPGAIRDVTLDLTGGAASGGNLSLALYAMDTGGGRRKLWDSGVIANPGTVQFIVADPGATAAVVGVGDQIEVAVEVDNTTMTFPRTNTSNNHVSLLPANFLSRNSKGALPKLQSFVTNTDGTIPGGASSFGSWPATLLESNMSVQTNRAHPIPFLRVA